MSANPTKGSNRYELCFGGEAPPHTAVRRQGSSERREAVEKEQIRQTTPQITGSLGRQHRAGDDCHIIQGQNTQRAASEVARDGDALLAARLAEKRDRE